MNDAGRTAPGSSWPTDSYSGNRRSVTSFTLRGPQYLSQKFGENQPKPTRTHQMSSLPWDSEPVWVVARPLALVWCVIPGMMRTSRKQTQTCKTRPGWGSGDLREPAEGAQSGMKRSGARRPALGLPRKEGRFFRGLLCGGGQNFQQGIDKPKLLCQREDE